MQPEKITQWLSNERFARYLNRCGGDHQKALQLYVANIQLSEACYPTLAVLEIVLRNAIHSSLTRAFGSETWYAQWESHPVLNDFAKDIYRTKEVLIARKEPLHAGKMVAEFTLGFWVKMFNTAYERELWKILRLCFRHLPKQERQRKTVSGELNRIRNFRNRIYHYESIVWSKSALQENYDSIVRVLGWIDPDIVQWTSSFDRFPEVLAKVKGDV